MDHKYHPPFPHDLFYRLSRLTLPAPWKACLFGTQGSSQKAQSCLALWVRQSNFATFFHLWRKKSLFIIPPPSTGLLESIVLVIWWVFVVNRFADDDKLEHSPGGIWCRRHLLGSSSLAPGRCEWTGAHTQTAPVRPCLCWCAPDSTTKPLSLLGSSRQQVK